MHLILNGIKRNRKPERKVFRAVVKLNLHPMTDLEMMRGLLHIRNELDKLIEKYDKETQSKELTVDTSLWASTGTGHLLPAVVHSLT